MFPCCLNCGLSLPIHEHFGIVGEEGDVSCMSVSVRVCVQEQHSHSLPPRIFSNLTKRKMSFGPFLFVCLFVSFSRAAFHPSTFSVFSLSCLVVCVIGWSPPRCVGLFSSLFPLAALLSSQFIAPVFLRCSRVDFVEDLTLHDVHAHIHTDTPKKEQKRRQYTMSHNDSVVEAASCWLLSSLSSPSLPSRRRCTEKPHSSPDC